MTFNWPQYTDERLQTLLESQLSRAPVSHAYVFYGVLGSGKDGVMQTFARAAQCVGSTRPCGTCVSCTAHEHHVHPDFVDIRSFSQGTPEITVDMVREFKKSLMRRPVVTQSKVGLISHAERLTLVAANALLKIFEDPPEHVAIVMSTSHLRSVPPTLISRCQTIHVRRLTALTMRALYGAPERNSSDTDQCLTLANGRIAIMNDLMHGGLEKYHGRISSILKMLNLFPNTMWQELDTGFRNQKKASSDGRIPRNFARELMHDFESVIRDILVAHIAPSLIRNVQFQSEIQSLAKRLPPRRVLLLLRSLFSHREAIEQDSANAQLHCEYLFLGV